MGIYLNQHPPMGGPMRKRDWLLSIGARPINALAQLGEVPHDSVLVVLVRNKLFDAAMVVITPFDRKRVEDDPSERHKEYFFLSREAAARHVERYHQQTVLKERY